jgi:hypothetical protein
MFRRGYPTDEKNQHLLRDAQHKRLKAMGRRKGLKVSEIIRRMIDDGLNKYEKDERE